MDFIPDEKPVGEPNRLGYAAIKLRQAYLEDGLAGYTSEQKPTKLMNEIVNLLTHAGAEGITFKAGQSATFKRPAYQLEFVWGGLPVRIVQVALPTHNRTDKNIEQSRRQALYNLLNSIRMELERRHYQPDIVPFAGHVVIPGTSRTLSQIMASDEIPALPAPAQPIQGEIVQL